MSIFRKKTTEKPYIPLTGFQKFLRNHKDFHWVATYVTHQNEIDEELAVSHMAVNGYAISNYEDIKEFYDLVAKLYSQYLGIGRDPRVASVDEFIESLPVGVVIRRIRPKAAGSRWSVQYYKRPKIYSDDLATAIDALLDKYPDVSDRFFGNALAEKANVPKDVE